MCIRDRDYLFVATCNKGAESLDPEAVARLHRIAQRTWWRTLDDRIGISWEEHDRKSRTPPEPLPVRETLLADKPEHRVERLSLIHI